MTPRKVYNVYADGERVGTRFDWESANLAAQSRAEARRPVSFSVNGRMVTRYYPKHKTVFLRSTVGKVES